MPKILFVSDLHGSRWKYGRLLELAKHHGVKALVNGGDMLPKDGNLFEQDKFINGYLEDHFEGVSYEMESCNQGGNYRTPSAYRS